MRFFVCAVALDFARQIKFVRLANRAHRAGMCRAMRADQRTKPSIVLFLSAVDEELEQRLFEETDADGYISKPIAMSALREQIEQALTQHADRIALIDKE